MADEEPQGPEDTLWWALDASADPDLPSASFDEPLVWPEALPWVDETATGPAPVPADAGAAQPDPEDLFFPPMPAGPPVEPPADLDLDAQWEASETVHQALDAPTGLVAALGGSSGGPPPPPARPVIEVPQSIWGADPPSVADAPIEETALLATLLAGGDDGHAGPVYADTESGLGGRRRRFDARHGTAVMIALIAVTSLVLLGMFLSVRSRTDVPTDVVQPPPPTTDGIAITGSLNTIPLTTLATTGPAPTINLADLVPSTTAGSTATPAATPRTTVAPTTPSATQPTTTTTPAPATTTVTTEPPVDNTTPTTSRRTTSSFTVPTIVIPTTEPVTPSTFVIPTTPPRR